MKGQRIGRGQQGSFRVLNKATEILNWDFRCSEYLRAEPKRVRIAVEVPRVSAVIRLHLRYLFRSDRKSVAYVAEILITSPEPLF